MSVMWLQCVNKEVKITRVFLPIDFRIMQLLYAARLLWWGIGAANGMQFAVPYLDFLRVPFFSYTMIIIGCCGLLSACKGWYAISYVFHIVGVFIFGLVSYSFFIHDKESVAGVNYFLEMLGLIWLTIRIRRFPMRVDNGEVPAYKVTV